MQAIINLPSTEDIGKLFSEKIPSDGIKTPSLKYGEKSYLKVLINSLTQ